MIRKAVRMSGIHVLVWHNHQEPFTSELIGLELIIHRVNTGASSEK